MSQRMRDKNDEALDALTRLVAKGPIEIHKTPTTFAVCVLSEPPKWYDAGTIQDALCEAGAFPRRREKPAA